MTRTTRLLLTLLLCAGPCASLLAQAPPPGPPGPPPSSDGPGPRGPGPREAETPMPEWEKLTQQQRQVLINALRERWNEVPEERPRMYRHARRWLDMTPEQRKQAKAGMDRFRNMSPEQRREAKALFERMRTLNQQERNALQQRWQKMSPAERSAWLREHPPVDD
ncbi:DUF3106 domain-containing protein [Xanthomonas hortorum]|uniref:DUF3106 domain-containing protein n=1 Tax=Xanthomonas hortorum pv. pelargonii TaxID=453602 RepID=A0A6V7EDV8_9XANT|nr:DUF3106 domain-containing protein [Xanthomonas hortorum]MCE4352848.1 DUF3106 domain-containing protein [Xanthomonas hortorum pv. pelargonii]MCM5524277.1 DUF3106 domain-containing protein [Xanthomonas hortorum pv. pelargonii]MCM5536933.1 DUF3106 domain-containing protein [Xanthomonas hortorum pv. pelargonii]MCM5540221.1 DUF3106 domain-containing protein [Xanthomonas hortorum pv. pelargonii]MCM5544412.1 DUF3106 domain-containing protein [Xanthomonas hortorum pv. pelargonii]